MQNIQQPQPQEGVGLQEVIAPIEFDEMIAKRAGALRNRCLQVLVSAGTPLERIREDPEGWKQVCYAVYKLVRLLSELSRSANAVLGEKLEVFLFHVGKAFRASGYPLERATAFARLLAWVLDRDREEAEDALVAGYENAKASEWLKTHGDLAKSLDRFKGAREVLAWAIDPSLPYEKYSRALDGSLLVVAEVSSILGAPLDAKAIARRVEPGKYYANDPLRGMLVLTAYRRRKEEEGEDEEEGEQRAGWTFRPKIVSRHYLDSVKILINPLDTSDRAFEVSLRSVTNPTTPPIAPVGDRTVEELAAILRRAENAPYPTQLQGVLSEIIGVFEDYKLADIDIKAPTTGFVLVTFEDGERLYWFESPRFKVNLPPPDPDKAREALRVLEEVLSFYKHATPAVGTILWAVQAPLGFVRKQLERDNKILLNYGEPQIGKTTLSKICGYLWGMREEQSVIGASAITPAQLAERLSETTLPRFLDEVKASVFANDTLMEMLKTATSGFHIKSRILVHQGFKMQEFIAYGSVALLSNILPMFPEGVPERLLAFRWTSEIKRSEKEYKDFADLLVRRKDLLAYIGSYLREMFLRRWAEVKELLKLPDQLEIGRRLLEMLYEELRQPIPQWLLKPVEPEKNLQSADLADIVRSIIVEDINRLVKGNWQAEECLTRVPCEERLLCLAGRLPKRADLPQQSFLPPYIVLAKKGTSAYITPAFIYQRLQYKVHNISMSDVAQALGGYTEPRDIGGKSMWVAIVDRRHLASLLWPECSNPPEGP